MALNAAKIQQIFKSKPDVIKNRHMRSRKEPRIQKCPCCSKRFIYESSLFVHIERSHPAQIEVKEVEVPKIVPKVDEFTCEKCGKKFSSVKNVRAHIARTHDPTKYQHQCSICKKSIANKYLMRVHMDSHSEDGVRACSHCGKLVNKHRLASHMLIHGEKTYRCEVCGKSFSQPAGLNQHMQQHNKEGGRKPKEVDVSKRTCNVCGKVLSSYMAVYSHKRQVHSIGGHKCPVCGKGCATRRALEEHKMVHSNDRPQVCVVCSATFKWERSFIEHMKRAHGIKQKWRPISEIM